MATVSCTTPLRLGVSVHATRRGRRSLRARAEATETEARVTAEASAEETAAAEPAPAPSPAKPTPVARKDPKTPPLSLPNAPKATVWMGIREGSDCYPEWGQSPYEDPTYSNTLWANWGSGMSQAEKDKFAERELMHARWAMLGTAGAWGAERATGIPWFQAGKVCTPSDCTAVNTIFPGQKFGLVPMGGSNAFDEYLPSFPAVLILTVVMMGTAEGYRTGLITPLAFPELKVGDAHPGGKHFDPLGLSKNLSEDQLTGFKLAEIKNGRLAMLAWAGYMIQAFVSANTFSAGGPLPSYVEGAQGPYGNFMAAIGR